MVERLLYAPGRRSLRAVDGRLILTTSPTEVAAIVGAHTAIDSPHVAGAAPSGDERVAFDCDAVADLAEVIGALEPSERVPYGFGVAFNEIMMDTLEAAHGAPMGPYCLGAMSWSNLLIGRDGHLWVFGFGANFCARLEDGRLADGHGSVQAPEVLFGAEATPASDVYLVHATLKRLLPHVDVVRELTGTVEADRDVATVRDALVQLDRDALDADPHTRPQTIAELRTRYRAIRDLIPSLPHADEAGFSRYLAERAAKLAKPVVSYDPDERTITFEGERIDLSRNAVLWRLFKALAEAEGPSDPDSLQAAIWPDEKIVQRAARNRLYVAIAGLRKAGLRTVLRKQDDGYLLAANVEARRS